MEEQEKETLRKTQRSPLTRLLSPLNTGVFMFASPFESVPTKRLRKWKKEFDKDFEGFAEYLGDGYEYAEDFKNKIETELEFRKLTRK